MYRIMRQDFIKFMAKIQIPVKICRNLRWNYNIHAYESICTMD